MALLTLPEYKSLMGVQSGNTRDDAQISALLESASRAVQVYTGRTFEVSTRRTTARSFLYDGSGFLDIDDCTMVTGVTVSVPGTTNINLAAEEWTAMPGDGPIFHYLLLHGGVSPYAFSPEMGFERNLDQYPAMRVKNPTLNVTATWGWPEVPSDVKLATALTIQGFLGTKNVPEGLTAEAIEGWSRSFGTRQGMTVSLAIPSKARDLLAAYQRVFV